jgi:tetratricopeptide (TPR) repeat protein
MWGPARNLGRRFFTTETKLSKLEKMSNDLIKQRNFVGAELFLSSQIFLNENLENPEISVDLYAKYAYCLGHLRKYDDAKTYFEKTLEILQKVEIPEKEKKLAVLLSNYSHLEFSKKKYDRAISLAEQSIATINKIKNIDTSQHCFIAGMHNNLSVYLSSTGNLDQAVEQQKISCDIYQKSIGIHNEYYQKSFNNLGKLLKLAGKDAEALQHANSWEEGIAQERTAALNLASQIKPSLSDEKDHVQNTFAETEYRLGNPDGYWVTQKHYQKHRSAFKQVVASLD